MTAMAVPKLADGERLDRDEFERRFDAHPDTKMAELLGGVVRVTNDGRFLPAGCRATFGWLIGEYSASTPQTEGGLHPHVRLDDRNEPQPDVCLIVRIEHGGQTVIDPEGVLASAPELAGYVVMTEQEHLTADRLDVYRRFGTREVLFWRVTASAPDWYTLRDVRFDRLEPDAADGLLKSACFPGLWIDPDALVRDDAVALRAALARGLASPDHAAFVARLRAVASAAPPG